MMCCQSMLHLSRRLYDVFMPPMTVHMNGTIINIILSMVNQIHRLAYICCGHPYAATAAGRPLSAWKSRVSWASRKKMFSTALVESTMMRWRPSSSSGAMAR